LNYTFFQNQIRHQRTILELFYCGTYLNMSREEKRIEDDGPRETKVSASVRYFSELGDKKRKKMRFISK
jgi:hypothetical protein